MSRTSETTELLKTLVADVAALRVAIRELQEDNASAAINAEKMYKTLNVKFDMFKNLESQSRETIQQTTNTQRKTNRPGFFKKIFTDEREKYMDILYTQEEIDAAYANKEVLAKRKDSEKLSKVIALIYTNHIKANDPEGRASAFDSSYEQWLKTDA